MASETDYTQLYEQAHSAYIEADYQQAAERVERLAQEFPNEPNVLLLRGHIYLGLHQYEQACQQYQSVLQLTDQAELVEYAQKGLEQAQQQASDLDSANSSSPPITEVHFDEIEDDSYETSAEAPSFPNWQEETNDVWDNEAAIDEIDWNSAAFDEEDAGEPTVGQVQSTDYGFENNVETSFVAPSSDIVEPSYDNPFELDDDRDSPRDWDSNLEEDFPDGFNEEQTGYTYSSQAIGEPTFMVSESQDERFPTSAEPTRNERSTYQDDDLAIDDDFLSGNLFSEDEQPSNFENRDRESENFLDNLEISSDDDLEDITRFDLTDVSPDFSDSQLFTTANANMSGNLSEDLSQQLVSSGRTNVTGWSEAQESGALGVTGISERPLKPVVEVEQGRLAKLFNASLQQKQLMSAAAAGISSVLAVLIVSTIATPNTGAKKFLTAVLGGAAGFGGALLVGGLATKQLRRATDELQAQIDTVSMGNFNAKATVYSEDELGQIATKFNQMVRVVATTTSEAQRRATEMEQAKEDLQRQVIRLLDDVEGAARGDLTVEAEVTADVLGAVADAFNLTIQNLREIVLQVKNAAKQVNKGSTDSELFARNQSSDALRMAEELAVTLNSVQMMTESIQRVAENAREAEEVARSSSVTALKGGEAVERTVAGILQIRETVSETARKVKRLAEASQEISKIVALISQIASRTNLLALNASIQAARAGEAGRGFAIVADEVRQLADRSAKSLKEIEQIVLQIQSETGSVMTAMEEGIQQVIDVTDKSEQAKRSLEDIIEVSNRIDTLVRSITGDTVKQRENSRSVAQVMQAVELTAQETSQESQRVAGSLQTLVSISRELLTSVERFRVEKNEA
jgi:twitching motility protein PilJ